MGGQLGVGGAWVAASQVQRTAHGFSLPAGNVEVHVSWAGSVRYGDGRPASRDEHEFAASALRAAGKRDADSRVDKTAKKVRA